jgi:signal transduction histidine kinase
MVDYSFGQKLKGSAEINYKVISLKEGFKTNEVHTMLFDDEGWLWVSGRSLKPIKNQINHRQLILQRYDGIKFHDVELPSLPEITYYSFRLLKREDGQLYALFEGETTAYLYLFNPRSLNFTKINVPSQPFISSLYIFPFNKEHLLITHTHNETKLFELKTNLELNFLSTLDFIENPNFNILIPFGERFLLEERNGVFWYNKQGNNKEKIEPKDLLIEEASLDYNLSISTWFELEGEVYIQFYEIPGYFSFDTVSNKWTQHKSTSLFPLITTDSYIKSNIQVDDFGNHLIQLTEDDGVSVYSSTIEDDLFSVIDNNTYLFSKVASRDLAQEVFIESAGVIYHFIFNDKRVKTFLENASIRSFLQLNDTEILVATEFLGWYVVNLANYNVTKLDLKLNNNSYIPTYNRGIFKSKDGFWSNYDKGIIHVNENTLEITSYIHYPVTCMLDTERYIYYGTTNYALMKFDKLLKTHTVVMDTPTYDMQAITKVGEVIYIASSEGLLKYENNNIEHFQPKYNKEDNILICLQYHEKYGLLTGSKSGKLYAFDPKKNKFSTLYEDHLNQSIASVLIDEHQNIWLNTFRGIVKFNPNSRATTRFSETEGLSFYEANRHSALQTNEGSFLIGTLRGLNYFHPEELSKSQFDDAELKFVTISHAGQESEKITINAPKQIENLKQLQIPPKNKNVHIDFAIFGLFNGDQIQYRYRLNDQNWINLQNQTEIDLFNLPSGAYTLQVEARNSLGEQMGNTISLSILAQEFFYESLWFKVTFLLLISCIGFIFYFQNRKKHLLKEKYAKQIIKAQENVRKRISKELHDNIGQKLLLVKMNQLKKNADTDGINLINNALDEIRNMSHTMHPFQFEKLGLKASLKNMINHFQRNSTVFYSCDLGAIEGVLDTEKELFVFRILQECVSNVEKHAKAKACILTGKREAKKIVFQIKDNGIGFKVEEHLTLGKGLGLKSIVESAQYIRAHFDIASSLGKGTTITLSIET